METEGARALSPARVALNVVVVFVYGAYNSLIRAQFYLTRREEERKRKRRSLRRKDVDERTDASFRDLVAKAELDL